MKELIIGAGSRPQKITEGEFENPLTLDINKSHNPDVVWDLNDKPWPFEDETFDEVHAYEILEHLGQQGDYKGFFADFMEIYRVLKPGGLLVASTPAPGSPWVWGDPGHTRYIGPESLVFLSQKEYEKQVGKTPMSDYRDVYTGDFDIELAQIHGQNFFFALKAIK